MDNDTAQQQFEQHQEEEWHEHQRRLLNQIHEVTETQIKNSAVCRIRAAGSCISTHGEHQHEPRH